MADIPCACLLRGNCRVVWDFGFGDSTHHLKDSRIHCKDSWPGRYLEPWHSGMAAVSGPESVLQDWFGESRVGQPRKTGQTLRQGFLVPGGTIGFIVTLTSPRIPQPGPAAPCDWDSRWQQGCWRLQVPYLPRDAGNLVLDSSPTEPGIKGRAEPEPRRGLWGWIPSASMIQPGSSSRAVYYTYDASEGRTFVDDARHLVVISPYNQHSGPGWCFLVQPPAPTSGDVSLRSTKPGDEF